MKNEMTTLFGIRHHGPGCARSLLAALDALSPEVILLEMPAEAEPLLVHAAHEAMKPPVAILLHRTDAPEKASFYPFAEFSPEWQAVRWAVTKGVPVRCFDLPSAHMFALRDEDDETPPQPDAFEWFAKADGYSDGERWWNDRVEERRNTQDFFEAILEAVATLRGDLDLPESRETLLREAWMRKCLRAAEKDGFANIAVVCGAWHTPALTAKVKVADDNELLRGLPKHKVAATWIPWTDERLAMASGYAAGIRSPGWYGHLWKNTEDPIPSWLTKAARILRKEGQEASSASVIEAVRLSHSLAGMRGRPLPGLDETLESIQAVFCQGDPLPLDFLRTRLLVGQRLGELPEGLPTLPLQQDIEASQKRLRLKPAASVTPLELDLREDGGRARSIFLHRLLALGIGWGRKEQARTRGTFKERWSLQWKPELAVAIIDASAFGNTIESAATKRLVKRLPADAGMEPITERLDLALLGALPQAVNVLLRRLDAAAATAHDLAELLDTVPPLARIARYGDVRATDAEAVMRLLEGFAARIHAGLLIAASGIDDDAARTLSGHVQSYRGALAMLELTALTDEFQATLGRMKESESVHPKLRGLSVRILRDASHLDDAEAARHLGFALSPGMPALSAAAWLEGFLQGGGSLLVHDRALLGLVHTWLGSLSGEAFQSTLPLLRRTFGTFEPPERARIAASVAQGPASTPPPAAPLDLDMERALPAVAAVAKLFGLPQPS
ncbi:DUF5682 family protein [Luteolibacter arcticus]|uniref:DUF5682 family protein n=1 Tax=Luteolibacter arcticus TaxID=1581411 RepID=A0ABT3GJE0_9BACT|nr:DUF5682 family protein [Luteolibacter arcticus]MCW1923612.1 DUF5682 family protein [Luteolibacter arcticus]